MPLRAAPQQDPAAAPLAPPSTSRGLSTPRGLSTGPWLTAWAPAALALVAVLLILTRVHAPVAGVLIAAALLSAPGTALLPTVRALDPWARAAMVVGVSLTIEALLALVQVWTGYWHPVAAGSVLLAAAAAAIIVREVRSDNTVKSALTGDPEGSSPPASPRRASGGAWSVVLDDGREISVSGTVLFGRGPVPRADERGVQLLSVADDSHTVSKTHLSLTTRGDVLFVTDRGSANGTTVTDLAGSSVSCPSNQDIPVSERSIVSFGEHWLEVRRGSVRNRGTHVTAAHPELTVDPAGGEATSVQQPSSSHRIPGRVHLTMVATLLLAVALWLVALVRTDTSALGPWGLLPAFPVPFYLGLALSAGVVLWSLAYQRVLHEGWLAAHLGLLVLILYGSASFVESAPRLPWVYKHIAVTRYIEANGAVNPSIDIYQRWPGFFALTAQLGQLTSYLDPVSYGRMVEPALALLDALMVLAIARTVSRDARWCWIATTIFCISNWVAQNYFAPQAFAYSLQLFICLLLLLSLRSRPRRAGLVLERALSRLLRGRAVQEPTDHRQPAGLHAWVIVSVLAAFSVIVASHQLTPYLLLLALGPLFVLGYFRPLLLMVVMVVITVLYLVPNLAYVEDHFGLFSGFDPVANATYTPVDRAAQLPSTVWQARGNQLLTAVVLLLACVGLVRRVRAGQARSAVLVAWFLFSPIVVLAVQSYGGEGRLRVYLFALPWMALAGAWGFRPTSDHVPRRVERLGLLTAGVVVLGLFVSTYFQPEADYRVPRQDVVAALWLDARVIQGDVVLGTGTFPALIGPHYDRISPDSLVTYKQYYPARMTVADAKEIARTLTDEQEAPHVYLVFAGDQVRPLENQGIFAPEELANLEAGLSRSPDFERVYDQDDVRIYKVR